MSDYIKREDAYKIALHYGSSVAAHKIAQLQAVDIASEEAMRAADNAFMVASVQLAMVTKENAELKAQLPKRGEWKKGVHSVACPICGSSYEFADDVFVEDLDMDEDLEMRYCPKCGSDNAAMMEVQDGK